jgi:hypothetical protein
MSSQGQSKSYQFADVAKAASSGDIQDYPLLPSNEEGQSQQQAAITSLLEGLRPFDEDTIDSSIKSTESKVRMKKLASRAKVKGVVKPMLAISEKIIVLPDSIKDNQNHIGRYMLQVSRKLGFKAVETPYTGTKNDLSEFNENIGLGIYMSLDDENSNFNIKRKTDPYEIGRTLARSQQIMGSILDLGHKNDILKPNHYYFGNNPGETRKVDKQVLRVNSFKTELLGLIIEKDWQNEMLDILIKLLRRSYTLLPHETIYHDIKPQLINYNQVITKWCSSERVITPARGKKRAEVIRKVPGKPKSSPLLLKPEMDLMNSLSARLFGKTAMEELEFDDWCALLLKEGLDNIRSQLKIIYNNRQTFLTKFAKLTTNRLNQVRHLPGVQPTIKKASVTTEQVNAVVLNREDPVSVLVQEILTIDPTGELFINQYFAGDTYNYAISTLSESDMRSLLSKTIVDKMVYDELRKSKDNKDPWVLRYLELEKAHRITQKEFGELRQKIQQSDKRRKVQVQKDITLYDLILEKAKVELPTKNRKTFKMVPHSASKPKASSKPAKPTKGKIMEIDPSTSWGFDDLVELTKELDFDEVQTSEEREENVQWLGSHPAEEQLMQRLATEHFRCTMRDFINSKQGMAIIRHMLLNIG